MTDDLLALYPFLARLQDRRGAEARCPAHDDTRASLTIGTGKDGRLLLRCHAGCTFSAICEALGIDPRQCFPPKEGTAKSSGNGTKSRRPGTTIRYTSTGPVVISPDGRQIIATYDYRGADGTLLYQVVRYHPKDFRQRRPDGQGGWLWSLKGVTRVLYRLPELLAADTSATVFVVEGEKDADRLRALGLLATTCPQGAGKWSKVDDSPLHGRSVVLLPDNDEPGRQHAEQVARALAGKAASVKILSLPGLAQKGDVSDWLDQGGTAEQLASLAAECGEWTEATAPKSNPTTPEPALRNYDTEYTEDKNGNLKPVIVPVPITSIADEMNLLTGDFPRCASNTLFSDEAGEITWLRKADALFAYLQRKCGIIDWKNGSSLPSKSEFYQALIQTQQAYEAVEQLPHWPMLPDHYYTCEQPRPGNGDTLRALVDRFSTETDIDRDLLVAAIATVFWGGDGGSRPVIVLTASGRGQGKSKAAQTIAHLGGGYIDISSHEDIGILKQRLLSPEGLTRRIAILDNVKTMKFSWAEFEAIVTSSQISGKAMYIGESHRPNTLTWFVTLNGVSLSTDIAQRCVVVKLAQPIYSPTWFEDVKRFIDANRRELLADVAEFFAREPIQLDRYSRWGAWEQAILSRLPEPTEAQRLITERQAAADAEHEESQIIEEFFRDQLAKLHYDPDTSIVHIPNATAVAWLNQATGAQDRTAAATRKLDQAAEEGSIKRLSRNPCRTHGRGFVWTGEQADPNHPVAYDIQTRLGWLGQRHTTYAI